MVAFPLFGGTVVFVALLLQFLKPVEVAKDFFVRDLYASLVLELASGILVMLFAREKQSECR